MARKNLLANITSSLNEANELEKVAQTPNGIRSEYTKRGASKSMLQSLDDLAEASILMNDGEAIVSLDPDLLDSSFIKDRSDTDQDDYEVLKEAISKYGQSVPILVRPSPAGQGRYMIVFGHRRAQATRDLGIKVRAIIKNLEDIEHVVTQGQENTARSNLSFIEKALFAQRLLNAGMSKDIVKSSLSVDDTLLSRMISVVETIPHEILEKLGSCKRVGRDRWEDLKKLLLKPENNEIALMVVASNEFDDADDNFIYLHTQIKKLSKPSKRPKKVAVRLLWAHTDGDDKLSVETTKDSKILTMKFDQKSKDFGDYVSSKLEELYAQFKQNGE
ncbi:plasmid partitioning protein RepB [Pseudochrobactrum kiredjianiae]|uniref:Plasmid partitioning protein RepB n=1 Tax=Pseudochrobactrum kiredjianiae TaxID=386305 RepID=A0ABW3UZU8_9HYPH|nr:plasmid partitioning protein RepB [Pseudochrobactrum kiredjianiae]MDM7852443.1 plasmid partitioning protein RepB [Pseudochrobactrum kiredjianiae]